MKVIIRNREKLLEIFCKLKPNPLKLLLFIILHERPEVEFTLKLRDITSVIRVQNPQSAVNELVENGFLNRVKVNSRTVRYILKLDIVDIL